MKLHNFKYLSRNLLGIVLFMLCSLTVFVVRAETVSQKQARQVARSFFDRAYGRHVTAPDYAYNGRRLTTGSYFAPFYVFNHPLGGFVIVSAENKMFPILGYSLTDRFDAKKMGKAQQALLTMYARHIENIRYNSEPVPEAEKAWQDIEGYIAGVLSGPYEEKEPGISVEESAVLIDYLLGSDDVYASTSDIYTPQQWEEMIDDEIVRYGSVALGLIGEKNVSPVVVYGTKGDYYRILLDGPDNAFYRLMPGEVMNFGQVAALGDVPEIDVAYIEEAPFEFLEQILADADEQIAEVNAVRTPDMLPEVPLIRDFRGGHYMVHLPEGAVMSRTYSLSGAEVHHAKHDGSSVLALDISPLPTGFYFIVVYGKSGMPYGLKVFR